MKEYMIACDLPAMITPQFMNLIPQQRAVVSRLFKAGKLTSYMLAMDRSKLWATMLADGEKSVRNTLAEFPIIEYLSVEVYELAFHDRARIPLPALSLN